MTVVAGGQGGQVNGDGLTNGHGQSTVAARPAEAEFIDIPEVTTLRPSDQRDELTTT